MICLMVINAMLYYKLRRIETLADGLRNDPNILAKYVKSNFFFIIWRNMRSIASHGFILLGCTV
jgi:hypothetical protein